MTQAELSATIARLDAILKKGGKMNKMFLQNDTV